MSGAANNHRHIPPELVEEILHKLPLKSVIRFSSVSKLWNSIIRGSNFVKTYRGRKLMVLKFGDLRDAFKTPLSSRDLQLRHATPLACPFKDSVPFLHATCDELWCVEVEGSLFLWNPSMQAFRKLPNPSLPPWPPRYRNEFSYGLGYDSVDGDYKMVKLHKTGEAELYSLRSNSWREIPHRAHDHAHGGLDWIFSRGIISNSTMNMQQVITIVNMPVEALEGGAFHEYHLKMGVFVAGALHWMAAPAMRYRSVKLISFDLSTEKYGELGLPELGVGCLVEMTVLKGMLCLCVNFWSCPRFVLWIMEDYGVVESWTKMLDIDRRISRYGWLGLSPTLRPFYFDDNGEILIYVCRFGVYLNKFLGHHVEVEDNTTKILVFKVDELQTLVEKDFRLPISDSFVYVETLVLM